MKDSWKGKTARNASFRAHEAKRQGMRCVTYWQLKRKGDNRTEKKKKIRIYLIPGIAKSK